MPAPIRTVLFLCTGNSARSILAESILNHEFGARFRGYSAGSAPKGQVHPAAAALLAGLGHDVSRLRSKSWDEFARADASPLDFVITVCGKAAGETCPVWTGHPLTAHWGLPDPAAVEEAGSEQEAAFRAAFAVLRTRIAAFAALPFGALDPADLRRRIGAIAALGNAPEPGA